MHEKIVKILGRSGRMVSFSKGRYTFSNPDNIVIFNANIFNSKKEKIWYGDLDLSTEDIDKINQLAIELKDTLHVLREMDGRFECEGKPKINNAVYTTNGNIYSFCKDLQITDINNRYYHKKQPQKKQVKLPEHADNKYKEEEFAVKIKINPEKYESDPLNKLYSVLEKKLKSLKYTEADMKKISLYFTKETEKGLLKIIEQFLIKKHKMKKGSYDLKKNMSWVILDLPICFLNSLKGPSWAKKNYIYIRCQY